MGKTSTLFYLYSNFEEVIISENLDEYDLSEFENVFELLERSTKKVPDNNVDNIIQFAKSYS